MEESQVPATRAKAAVVLAADTKTLKTMLESAKESLRDVLPRHLTPDRLVKVALVAVSKTPLLQKCSATSILQCVMTAGQLGLDCGGVMGSSYMVPYWNKNTGTYEATLIPGYRGLIDLARRSGQIEDISANVVYEGDEYDFALGDDAHFKHKPSLTIERSDDKIVCAYMVAHLKDTKRPHIEVMTRAELQKVEASSHAVKSGRSTPYQDWRSEMWRKAVIRRGVKQLPISIELAEALQLDMEGTARVTGEPVIDTVALNSAASRADGLAARLQAQREAPAIETTAETIPERLEPPPPAEQHPPTATAAQEALPTSPADPGEALPLPGMEPSAQSDRERRKAALDTIWKSLISVWPKQDDEDKTGRNKMLGLAFNAKSWADLESRSTADLEMGARLLHEWAQSYPGLAAIGGAEGAAEDAWKDAVKRVKGGATRMDAGF